MKILFNKLFFYSSWGFAYMTLGENMETLQNQFTGRFVAKVSATENQFH